MKQFFLACICLFSSHLVCAQINFYIGADLLSTKVKAINAEEEFQQTNPRDFALYIGNELQLHQSLALGVDVFYQNNNTIIKHIELDDTRFEFHQNIGLRLKPSFQFKNNSIALIAGVSGLYVFDKKELTGNQIDRYDEAYIYGLEYNKAIHPKWSINCVFQAAKFHSISHYTSAEMLAFSTFSIGLQYNLYGKNK